MDGDKVEEVKWKGLGVNDHWQQMKVIMMETAQDICGMTKSPPRHKETWWWNEECQNEIFRMAKQMVKERQDIWVKLYKKSIRESDCR